MEAATEDQYVLLQLAKEQYGVRIFDIHEIIRIQKITEIPNGREFLKGVINLRGKIIPVICLRKRFNLPEEPYTKSSRIVVVNVNEVMVGIIVDAVNKVTVFSQVEPTPEILSGVDIQFFEGLGHCETGIVSILRMERVLFAS